MGLRISCQNFTALSTLVVLSLATGYYLGQLYPSPTVRPLYSGGHAYGRSKQNKEQCSASVNDGDCDGNDYELSCESDDEEIAEVSSMSLNSVGGEVRMALVIRQDLNMTKGKIAAQCCHAALACYRLIAEDPNRISYNMDMTSRWLSNGQAKITLKCPDKETMDELYAKALSLGVNSYVVHDAGRTQIAAGSATVLGLGPAPKAVLDTITGDLKLY